MLSRSVLSSCRKRVAAASRLSSRSLATVTDAPAASASHVAPSIVKKKGGEQVALHTAVLLNRSPLITRTPTPFERAYYAYQTRIERALHNPLPYDFYFKPNSPLELQFDKEELEREKEAFGRSATPSPRITTQAEAKEDGSATDLPLMEVEQEEVEKPMPREHEADRTGDVKSLDRQGQRNIFLLVLTKDASGKESWKFPQAPVPEDQNLFDTVQSQLRSPFGERMDTWVVSRNPVGVHQSPSTQNSIQDCLFFYKAHVLAGQARVDGQNVLDFAWLTKEEIQSRVDRPYWDGVKNMISDF